MARGLARDSPSPARGSRGIVRAGNGEQRRRSPQTSAPHVVAMNEVTIEDEVAVLQAEAQRARAQAEEAERRLREREDQARRRRSRDDIRCKRTNIGEGPPIVGSGVAQKRQRDDPSQYGGDRQQRQVCSRISSSSDRSLQAGISDDLASHCDSEAAVVLISKLMSNLGTSAGADLSAQHTGAAMTAADLRAMLQRLCMVVSAATSRSGNTNVQQHLVPSCNSSLPRARAPFLALPAPGDVGCTPSMPIANQQTPDTQLPSPGESRPVAFAPPLHDAPPGGQFSDLSGAHGSLQTLPAIMDVDKELERIIDQEEAAKELQEAKFETARLRRELEVVSAQQARQEQQAEQAEQVQRAQQVQLPQQAQQTDYVQQAQHKPVQQRSHVLSERGTVADRPTERPRSQSAEETLMAELAEVNRQRQNLTDKMRHLTELPSRNGDLGQESVETAVMEALRLRRTDLNRTRLNQTREQRLVASQMSTQADCTTNSSHVTTVQAKDRDLQHEVATARSKREETPHVSQRDAESRNDQSRLQQNAQQQDIAADTAHQVANETASLGTAPMNRRLSSAVGSALTSYDHERHDTCPTLVDKVEVGSRAARLKRHPGDLVQEELAEAENLRAALATEAAAQHQQHKQEQQRQQQQRPNTLLARFSEPWREATSPQQSFARRSAFEYDSGSARHATPQEAASERKDVRRQMEDEFAQATRDVEKMRERLLCVAEREESQQAGSASIQTERGHPLTEELRSELDFAEHSLKSHGAAPTPLRGDPAAHCTPSRKIETDIGRTAALSRLASVHRRRQVSGRARENDSCQQQ